MGRTDQASRVIKAPRSRIYQALIDRESLEAWLPPNGMRGEIDRFEPWSGGGFRMMLTYLDPSDSPGKTTADSDVTDVEFGELVPDERVVWRVVFESEDPSFAGTMIMTWGLTDTEGGTEVEVRAEDVPSGIPHEVHEEGLSSSLANLAAHVEG